MYDSIRLIDLIYGVYKPTGTTMMMVMAAVFALIPNRLYTRQIKLPMD